MAELRVVVTSDWHVDASTGGFSREQDVQQGVLWAEQVAIDFGADLFLFLGDLCDPDPNRAPRCAAFAIGVAKRLRDARIKSRWLNGNHDVIEDGSGTSTLEPLAAMGGLIEDVRVWGRPTTEILGGVHFIALPYTPRCEHYDASDVLGSLLEMVPTGAPLVVCGHLAVNGASLGSESHELARGRAMAFPSFQAHPRLLRALCLNGHYHQAQITEQGVVIPGALERLTFGERQNQPCALLVHVGDEDASKPRPGKVKGARKVAISKAPRGMTMWTVSRPNVRALLDIPPTSPQWDLGGLVGNEVGAIVRMQPPEGATDEQIGALYERVRGVAASVRLMPRPHVRTVPQAVAQGQAQAPGKTMREVVMSVAAGAAGVDKAALSNLLGELLTEVKL